MSTETVVFFYAQEKTIGRKYPWQKIAFQVHETKWCGRRLVAAGIPEYDFNKRAWKKEVLRKKIQTELIQILQVDFWESACFLCHKSLSETEMGRLLEEVFPLELIVLPGKKGMAKVTPVDVTESLLGGYCHYDALIVLDGTSRKGSQLYAVAEKCEPEITPVLEWQDSIARQLDMSEFIRQHCNHVNYLAVVTADEERYVEVFEEMNEEYGLAGMFLVSLEQVKPPAKYQVLVVDIGIDDKYTWRDLPPCCTYLDLISSTERQRVMEARRKDVRYISFYRQIEKKLRQKIQFLGIHP